MSRRSSSSGSSDEAMPLRRRALLGTAAALTGGIAKPRSTTALDLPSAPTLPSVSLPEISLFTSEEQKAAEELSVYRKPLSDMTRMLNSMGEEQVMEDKVYFFSTISYFFSATQKPSLLLLLQRLTPLLGDDGETIALQAKEAVANLQTALRASKLGDEKQAVRDLSAALEAAFEELRKRDPKLKIPPPKEVGNGSFFGVLPATKA